MNPLLKKNLLAKEDNLGLKIIKAGIRSLIQDLGRYGHHKIGLGVSGALDEHSYLMAHYLLQNTASNNALEIFMGNFQAEVLQDTNIAITGADCLLLHNQKKVQNWSRFPVKAGDTIEIKEVTCGSLNYLAVEGSFDIKPFKNSYATNFKLGVGANAGKKLSQQTLSYNAAKLKNPAFLDPELLPQYLKPDSKESLKVRIILNEERDKLFYEKELQVFFQSHYTISLDSDRMGFRMEGEKITPKIIDLPSESLAYGTVQVPKQGLPILLMKDCQTIGGYSKLGYLPAVDIFKIAQLRPKQKISFSEETAENSQAELKELYKSFR